jgi:hypothetical protein
MLSVQSPQFDDLKPVIGCLREQLRDLRLELASILKRIMTIKKTVSGLADLFGSDVVDGGLRVLLSPEPVRRARSHPGLTDLCRQFLREASEPLTVHQILRQFQERSSAGLARHRHPAHSLRMILRRLVDYGEAEQLLTDGGVHAWRLTARSCGLGKNSPGLGRANAPQSHFMNPDHKRGMPGAGIRSIEGRANTDFHGTNCGPPGTEFH